MQQVIAVSLCATHAFSKQVRPAIRLLKGLGVEGDAHHGVTTSTPAKMHYKRQLMSSADKTFLLADSSKYAKFSPWLVAEAARFDHIITDGGLPAEAQAALHNAGARLRIAD